jgi:hypothetical protein
MASFRRSILVLLLGSTTACVGPLAPLAPLRPLAPEPVCQNRMVETPSPDGTGSPSSNAQSECSVSMKVPGF